MPQMQHECNIHSFIQLHTEMYSSHGQKKLKFQICHAFCNEKIYEKGTVIEIIVLLVLLQ